MAKPIVNRKYNMIKWPGKGGWTYVIIEEIPKTARGYRGFVKVKGSIDNVAIDGINLMPMKDGRMFFPIKADIRKQIKKEAPAAVKIVLYLDAEVVHGHSKSNKKQPLPRDLRL